MGQELAGSGLVLTGMNGADRHEDGECTGVECDLVVGGLCSVTALTASYVLICKASWGG
jgi:hypothetical protein